MSDRTPILLPAPRSLALTDGRCAVRDVREVVDPGAVPRGEGYRLVVEPDRILVIAHDPRGVAHGRRTLGQIVRQADRGGTIPCLRIDDWPDLPNRGFMLDISRDKVPTMDTLRGLVDLLAELKYNQLQLYLEHTFAYAAHPEVWRDASPLTGEEVEELDAYCRARFIELVPNQNSFGHMERWLRHPRYADLAEVPVSEPGDAGPRSLCPVDPRALDLIAGLYDELLPRFSSRQLNVGCDETVDLGRGRSREACEAKGVGRVYLDFLLAIHREVARRGRTMQFWGDIVLNHRDLVPELPLDAIALEWGYEAGHPFHADGETFAAAGIPHYVCPGTSSWLSIAGRTTNAIANIREAAAAASVHGAAGMLITDWGDHGHWQPLPVSYLGLAWGAAASWCRQAQDEGALARALDLHVFRDRAAVMGSVAHDLGDAHLETGAKPKNAAAPALLLLFPDRSLTEGSLASMTVDGLDRTRARVAEILTRLGRADLERPDGALVLDEFRYAAALLDHGARLGIARLEAEGHAIEAIPATTRRVLAEALDAITPEFDRVWLARNRSGGRADSVARLTALRRRYEARGQSS